MICASNTSASQCRCTDRFQNSIRDHFGSRAVFLASAVKDRAAPNDPIQSRFAAVALATVCAMDPSSEYGFCFLACSTSL